MNYKVGSACSKLHTHTHSYRGKHSHILHHNVVQQQFFSHPLSFNCGKKTKSFLSHLQLIETIERNNLEAECSLIQRGREKALDQFMVFGLNINVMTIFYLDPTQRTTQSYQRLTASEQHLWSDLIILHHSSQNGWVMTDIEGSWAACL